MIPKLKADEKFTYTDYQTWPDDERWELIEGEAWDMSPAPNTGHQSISMILSGEFYNYLKDKPCNVFAAPFDVRLQEEEDSSEDEIITVVQPDIAVICDKDKIDKKGCLGAPDIVIEILSPSTAFKDETNKLKLYEKHGVKEYWIVNPEANYIIIYHLKGNRFTKPEYYRDNDIIESSVLKDLKINLADIFKQV